jgi:hypothetical protein
MKHVVLETSLEGGNDVIETTHMTQTYKGDRWSGKKVVSRLDCPVAPTILQRDPIFCRG